MAKLLVEKGYSVVGITRDTGEPNLERLHYLGVRDKVVIDGASLNDFSNVIKLIEQYRPDEVYHLAAQSFVSRSFKQPIGTIQFNIISTANLLEAIRMVDVNIRFYQASSSEMYGLVPKENLPVTEETPLHPVSPYAISKASAHWLTVNYREAYGLFAACGILFNHESALRSKGFVTKKIITTALKIKSGEEDRLKLGNLKVSRDWGYAPKYVENMWLMLNQDEPDDFTVCSGEAHSLEEFVFKVFEKLELDQEKCLETSQALFRPLDIEIIYGSVDKTKEKLGWSFDMSFDELIERLLADERKFMAWQGNQRDGKR